MIKFKVQKIRSCEQCGDVLALKCDKCKAHPDRQPVVKEFFEWPPFLEVCKSGHCVRIQCQRKGCTGTPWKTTVHYAGKMAPYKNLYCNGSCAARQRVIDNKVSVSVNCAYDGKPLTRSPSRLKRRAFCNQTCCTLWMRRDGLERKEAEKAKLERLQNLYCEKCREVQIHDKVGGDYQCQKCLKPRKVRSSIGDVNFYKLKVS